MAGLGVGLLVGGWLTPARVRGETGNAPLLGGGGPGLHETGRVALQPTAGLAGRIATAPLPADEGRDVAVRARRSDAAAPGGVNLAVIDMESKPYFDRLRGCLLEVARRKQVVPNSLSVGEVQLSWTILPNGLTAEGTAVAAPDADGDVLRCVGQKMFGWRFTPPAAAPTHVTYRVALSGATAPAHNRLAQEGAPAAGHEAAGVR